MTVVPGNTRIVDAAGRLYRAKSISMAEMIGAVNQRVFPTAVIDTNHGVSLGRTETPAVRIWHVFKPQTNLTNEDQAAWQTTREGATAAHSLERSSTRCQEHRKLSITESIKCFCFYGKEICPDEIILMPFMLDKKIPRIVMAHNRAELSMVAPAKAALEEVPPAIEDEMLPKPYIEPWDTSR